MANVSVELDDTGDKIIVVMPYNEDAKEKLKTQFAARWNPDDKCWLIDAHDHAIKDVQHEVAVHFTGYRP